MKTQINRPILVTAFTPFNNDLINPSYEILKALMLNDIVKIVLPVSYEKSIKELKEAIIKYNPRLIVSLGYAASKDKIAIEMTAYNEMTSSIADNDGIIMNGCKISENGPLSISTKINLNCFSNALIYKSFDPGRFICNLVYFNSLLELKGKAIFIHVPSFKAISLEKATLIIEDIIKHLK